jgi:hypothetical protein
MISGPWSHGKEAEKHYDAILKTQPERSPNAFDPDEYTGGNRSTPQFEVERFYLTLLPYKQQLCAARALLR